MAYVKKDYIQSDAVTQAQQALQNQQANKPGQYQSQWQGQMNDLMGQIQNRPAFQYDVNADALYQQVAQNYIQQGKQAMMDTMGQAASMTGGYGNSYAQTVGQQQYNNHLLGLTEMVPQFQQMALQKYQMEGDDLLSRYGMLADLEDQEYGRYQDSLNQYLRELDRLQGIYDNERSFDYGKWADGEDFAYGQYRDDVADQQWKDSFAYQQSQDQKAYEQWLQEFQYQQEQDRIAQEQWQKEFEENQRRYNQEWAASQAKSSSGSSVRRSSTPSSSTQTEDKDNAAKSALSTAMGEVSKIAHNAAQAGVSESDVNKILTAARQDGIITKDQYKALKYLRD